MSRNHRTPRPRLLVLFALLAALVLAGCGGGDEKEPAKEERPTSQPTQGGKVLAALWPLTGKPAPAGNPGHPVVVVKIDNTASSAPQVGLGRADIVVQEMVEGGVTRLAAMFHTRLPRVVGPVRSLRATDIGIVRPTRGLVVASGAAPPTHARLNAAKVRYVEGGAGYFREGGRRAPYNLMVNLREAVKASGVRPIVPQNYLPWGTSADFKGTQPARRITATYKPGGNTTQWRYNPQLKRYVNVNTYAARDDQFRATSVLVLRVRQGDAGYLDPGGNPVPETLFTGRGNALLFHGGKVVAARWQKPKPKSPIMLRLPDGQVLKVPAGKTWIELLPGNPFGGSVSWGR